MKYFVIKVLLVMIILIHQIDNKATFTNNNISQSELKVLNNIDNLINFYKGKIFKQIIFSTTKNKLSL